MQLLGYQKGDVLAIILPNSCWLAICYFAILKIGGVVVLLNPLLTHPEFLFQLQNSKAKGIFVFRDAHKRTNFPSHSELPDLKHVLQVTEAVDICKASGLVRNQSLNYQNGILPSLVQEISPFLRQTMGYASSLAASWGSTVASSITKKWNLVKSEGVQWHKESRVQDLEQLLLMVKDRNMIPVKVDFNDLALIQYTGGTTGVIKGAMLTHGNLSFNVNQLRSWFYFFKDGEENFLAAIPYCQIFGLAVNLNLAVKIAATITLMPHFSASTFDSTVSRFRPTVLVAVPLIYNLLLDSPQITKMRLNSFTNYFSGHAALPAELKERWLELTGLDIIEGYGMTEASPVIAINPIFGEQKAGSVGLPLPLTEVRIVSWDDAKTVLGPNSTGEVWIKGPQVMSGYWHAPEETQMAFSEDGWFKTGDVAYFDNDGYLFLVDRLKDVVNISGYTIFTREIDDLIKKHPGVQEAVAVGTLLDSFDIIKSCAIKVYVVLKPEAKISEEDIINFCRQSLAAYKIPRSVEFLAQLPKTATGEILKKNLRSSGGSSASDSGEVFSGQSKG